MKREDQTPEQREIFAERRRERDRAKSKRRKAEVRAAKAKAITIVTSKTDPVTRRRLYGRAPEMTKIQLRAVIAQAFRNTAEALV